MTDNAKFQQKWMHRKPNFRISERYASFSHLLPVTRCRQDSKAAEEARQNGVVCPSQEMRTGPLLGTGDHRFFRYLAVRFFFSVSLQLTFLNPHTEPETEMSLNP